MGGNAMITAPATRPGRSFVLASLFRRVWQYRDRRFQRDMQQRAEWVYEAQHAPTVQEWFGPGGVGTPQPLRPAATPDRAAMSDWRRARAARGGGAGGVPP